MPKWEILERENTTSPWMPIRGDYSRRFNSKDEAMVSAKRYVTERNVDNALASGEKEAAAEVFLVDDTGCFLGNLDGKEWYIKYKQDIKDAKDRTKVIFKKGDVVKSESYFELDKKGQITVKEVPKT